MCKFSNKLVTSGRKFQKQKNIFEKSMKKLFFEKIQAKSIFFKIQGEISHFFKKSAEKHDFVLPKKRIEKRVTRKFGESFTLKLSVAR